MQIMDECKRVLRDDGTMWVNLGDSYSGSGKAGNNPEYQERHTEFGKPSTHRQRFGIPTNSCDIPTKSLCLIPYRFAIKMVDRGWILRNVIIWHKPNSMPSSVKDRFSVDFEYVFFFVKSRKYWFEQQYDGYAESTLSDKRDPLDAPRKERGYPGQPQHGGHLLCDSKKGPGRNRRCVWTIPTQPYPESHFATFPEALIEPMIKAGCPKEICIKCGKAREAVYEGTSKEAFNIRVRDVKEGRIKHTDRVASQEEIENYKEGVTHAGEGKKLKGYTDCGCNAGFRPGIILDPFCGSGTTMRVAEKLNRVGIGFDLAYGDLQDKRMRLIQKQLL
jgi:DNA modification methylase